MKKVTRAMNFVNGWGGEKTMQKTISDDQI